MTTLSIVIPAYNRPETLFYTLKTLEAQDHHEHFEVVISDDAPNDSNLQVFKSFSHLRNFKYFKNDSRMGMRGNYEVSIERCKGKFITILGDDDGFVRSGVKVSLEIIQAAGDELDVMFWWPHMYWWPNALIPEKRNLLYIYKPIYQATRVNPFDYVASLFKHEENFWLFERLPSIYNGFVSRAHLERLKARTGCYFADEIPDVYSGVANGVTARNAVFSGIPISIRGLSGKSFGVAFRNPEGARIAEDFKAGMRTPMCAEELIESSALAVHVASVKIRAKKTFSQELSSFNVSIQKVIDGIISEAKEGQGREVALLEDCRKLAEKYNLRLDTKLLQSISSQPLEKNYRQQMWGWNNDQTIAVNTSKLGYKQLSEIQDLICAITTT